MQFSATLFRYFVRQFAIWYFGTIVALAGIVFLLDLTELMRRGSGKPDATFAVLLEMAWLKTPEMILTVLPFSILIGSMLAITRMTRSQELAVARASGVSVWQFLLPALLLASAIGIAKITVLNPVSSVLTAEFERLENRILRNRASALAVSPAGFWLRERSDSGSTVLHARNIDDDGEQLRDVTIFLFEGRDQFRQRIDSALVRLEPGYLFLPRAAVRDIDGNTSEQSDIRLPTAFTPDSIQNSFSSPETMSFWELPAFITVLEDTGFSAVRHRLHLHRLLATPLTLCAMVLIAAAFSLHRSRAGSTVIWSCVGLLLGFLLYFFSDLVFALGLASRIPEVLAAWTPATVTTLLGVSGLLHLEDG